MPNRSGQVTEIQLGAKNKGKCKVNGRTVNFWVKGYQTEEETAEYDLLRQAERDGLWVTVEGDEYQGQGPSGPYTSFTAQSVEITGVASNGAHNGSQGQEQRFVGREAGANDRWVAARWALSVAADIKINGVKIVGEYDVMPLVEQAWWLLEQSKGLAERLEG